MMKAGIELRYILSNIQMQSLAIAYALTVLESIIQMTISMVKTNRSMVAGLEVQNRYTVPYSKKT